MADRGYPVEFSADITLFKGVEAVSGGRVMVNHPIVCDGFGIYVKNAGMGGRGRRYVFFDANRDDGAKVVLAGAVLFTLANILYVLPHRRNDAGGEGEVSWKG